MLQQAIDFRDESEALFQLLEPLAEADYSAGPPKDPPAPRTRFKQN